MLSKYVKPLKWHLLNYGWRYGTNRSELFSLSKMINRYRISFHFFYKYGNLYKSYLKKIIFKNNYANENYCKNIEKTTQGVYILNN